MKTNSVRDRIIEAAEQLLSEKRIGDLTVSQICDHAQVSRYSFYRHFHDKYDVSNQIILRCNANILYYVGRTIKLRDAYVMILYEFLSKKKLIQNTCAMDEYNSMPQFAIRTSYDTLRETLIQYKKIEFTEKISFQLEAFMISSVHQINRWIRQDMSVAPEHFADLIMSTLPKELSELL